MSRLEQKVAFLVCVFLICLVLAGCGGGLGGFGDSGKIIAQSVTSKCPAILPPYEQAEVPQAPEKAEGAVPKEELQARYKESQAENRRLREIIDRLLGWIGIVRKEHAKCK